MSSNITFHLNSFDGPLDLLLHLISKNKVSIYDIPISDILQQYLAILNDAKQMDMEIASEFIAIAAQLVYIKSKMLLPRYDTDDEDDDPRSNLVEMLLEYQRIKAASAILDEQSKDSDNVFTKQPEHLSASEQDYQHTTDDLIKACRELLKRTEKRLPPSEKVFHGIVGRENVPVSEMITRILDKFTYKSSLTFESLLEGLKSRSEVVAAFLAVLELSKKHQIILEGTPDRPIIRQTHLNGEDYG